MAEQQVPLLYTYGDEVTINNYVCNEGLKIVTRRNIPATVTDRVPITANLGDCVSVNLIIETSRARMRKGVAKNKGDLPAMPGGTIQICYKTTLGNINGAEEKRRRMHMQYG